MSKRCELTGNGVMSGHNVSHSNRKTKRKFFPNLQKISFHSDALNSNVTLNITAATLRTVNKYGNIDSFLINYKIAHLTDEAKVLRNKIKKVLTKKGEYENVKIVKEKKVRDKKTKRQLKAEKGEKKETPKKKVEAKGKGKVKGKGKGKKSE